MSVESAPRPAAVHSGWGTQIVKGGFEHRPIVGAFDPTPFDSAPTKSYFGLPLMCTWFYLNWRDDEGNLYEAHRTILGLEASVGFLLNAPAGGELRQWAPSADQRFFSGTVITAVDKESHRIFSRPSERNYAAGMPFECKRTHEGLEYHEGDTVQFTGRRIGPGMQFYVPTGETPLYYTSIQHRISGHCLGRPAEGFLWWDQCYLPPGVTWRNSDYFKWAELAWTVVGNEYEDGSMDVGHICYGADGFNFAFIVNERGEVKHCTTDVTARDIEYKPNTFPGHMYYVVDGQDWEWTVDPIGDCPDMASGQDNYRSSEGYLRRAGEQRKPVVWHAYNEFFPRSIQRWQAAVVQSD